MKENTSFLPELEKASGHFDYPLTNDYIFRSLCQKNNKALKGLISALLHIPPEQICSVVIMNPIVVGEACSDKEFRMDVRVELNGNMVINLEMQVKNYHDWPERSISYLSRIFDSLSHGDDYLDVIPAVHIGILDFTLFPEAPSFYSCNKLMDEKTYHIYSDKFAINVLDLSKETLATDEDKQWKLDYWARLFKATTWEDIKMIAANNEYLKEASNTLYHLNADFEVREHARNREEYYRALDTRDSKIKEQDARINQQNVKINQQNIKINQQSMEIEKLKAEIAQLKAGQNL